MKTQLNERALSHYRTVRLLGPKGKINNKLSNIFFIFSLCFFLIVTSFYAAKPNIVTGSGSSVEIGMPTPANCVYSLAECLTYYEWLVSEKYDDEIFVDANSCNISVNISIPNLEQNVLNASYNASYRGTNPINYYTGTCLEVADTQILKWYVFTNYNDDQGIFNMTLNRAIGIECFTPPSGSVFSLNDMLLDGVFYNAGSEYDANNDHYDLTNNLISELDDGNPTVLVIPNHATVARGYLKCRVDYTRRVRKYGWFGSYINKSYVDTYYIFIVNNGWSNAYNSYIYYPAELIEYDHTNYGITKIL